MFTLNISQILTDEILPVIPLNLYRIKINIYIKNVSLVTKTNS